MQRAGAPEEVIASFKEQQKTQTLVIHPMNWNAVKWFLEVCELWQWRSPSHCIGLDWLAVEAEARMRGQAINHNDFKKLKIIASEACYLINKNLQQ